MFFFFFFDFFFNDTATTEIYTLSLHDALPIFSILPLLLGHTQDRPVRNSIVHHSGDGMFSLRRGEWKYIEDVGSGGFSEPSRYVPGPGESRAQLYNIVNDSRENLNLWKTRPEIVDDLEGELNRIKKSKNTKSSIE